MKPSVIADRLGWLEPLSLGGHRLEANSASAATLLPTTEIGASEARLSLVDRARLGERGAFLGLFQAHAARVNFLSLQIADDVQTAEKLTRDVFLEAFRHMASIRDEAAFSSWLHRRAVKEIFTRHWCTAQ